MSQAHFRFHGELNFFLPHQHRRPGTVIVHPFNWRASVKDMIESLGPPHPEVGLLLINGQPADFDAIVQPDDMIDVYDCYSEVGLMHTHTPLRPAFSKRLRFVLDTHLGRLASYLRMMGFDTLYRNDFDDDELATISHFEERILLTRDIGLLKRSMVIHGRFMRETNPRRQVIEIIRCYPLADAIEPFRHCMKCNGLLRWVEKDAIADRVPYRTIEHYDDFRQCPDCEQVYWKGSHYNKMQSFLAEVLKEA